MMNLYFIFRPPFINVVYSPADPKGWVIFWPEQEVILIVYYLVVICEMCEVDTSEIVSPLLNSYDDIVMVTSSTYFDVIILRLWCHQWSCHADVIVVYLT